MEGNGLGLEVEQVLRWAAGGRCWCSAALVVVAVYHEVSHYW